jgi:hypothetical protein
VAIKIPAADLAHCVPMTTLPATGSITVGQEIDWADDLALTLAACNAQLDAIAKANIP